jgi:hypothetical protein
MQYSCKLHWSYEDVRRWIEERDSIITIRDRLKGANQFDILCLYGMLRGPVPPVEEIDQVRSVVTSLATLTKNEEILEDLALTADAFERENADDALEAFTPTGRAFMALYGLHPDIGAYFRDFAEFAANYPG